MKFLLSFLIVAVLVALALGEDECTHGDSKKIDCNSCTCANGKWACTRKICIPNRTKRERHCEPGTTYKKDCNTCVCNKDGTNAACTLKACL